MNMYSYRKLLIKISLGIFIMILFSSNALKAQDTSDLQDVQQIVAIVNDSVISLYDLKQRAMLISITSNNRQRAANDNQIIQSQAMQALIDDKLKLQEAGKYDADADENSLRLTYNNYARQFNLGPDELEAQLNSAGIQKESLMAQINGSISWQGVISGLLEPLVNVTDDEVYNEIDFFERNKGKDEYKVSEIYILITDNARREETIATANIIYQQLQEEGASFSGVAQQISQSSTAAVGGDMGWVMKNTLPDEVNDQIIELEVGEISKPIETEGGIYILLLTDKRQILTLDEKDIGVEIKHYYFDSPESLSDEEFNSLNDRVMAVTQDTDNCELVEERAAQIQADQSGVLGEFNIGDFPDEIGKAILTLEEGQSTKLFREQDGYRAFIMCKKIIPVIDLPDFETMLENLTQSRVQLIARRHLRDLRRDAIVDYR